MASLIKALTQQHDYIVKQLELIQISYSYSLYVLVFLVNVMKDLDKALESLDKAMDGHHQVLEVLYMKPSRSSRSRVQGQPRQGAGLGGFSGTGMAGVIDSRSIIIRAGTICPAGPTI
jgi:hypothetical protein